MTGAPVVGCAVTVPSLSRSRRIVSVQAPDLKNREFVRQLSAERHGSGMRDIMGW